MQLVDREGRHIMIKNLKLKNFTVFKNARFFNLSGKGKVEQGDSPEQLGDILLLDEAVLQSQRRCHT